MMTSSRRKTLLLSCEWNQCNECYDCIDKYMSHIQLHIQNIPRTNATKFQCEWRDCTHSDIEDFLELTRHVYFHGFHAKLKNFGQSVIVDGNLNSCEMSEETRNSIPDIPDRFYCGWQFCEMISDNPYYFYEHVRYHREDYKPGNDIKDKCKCLWEGCESLFKNRSKLRDHLRSHTQEKLAACPTCGALFANSTKLKDHVLKQDINSQNYECSHCQKRFSTERLLRDHVRSHVNNYKCPFCEMTTKAPAHLKRHIKYRHSDEKDFTCEYCNSAFKGQRDLERHISAVHIKDTVFTCSYENCTYKTKHEFQINAHIRRKHTSKESRYVCDICDKKCKRGDYLTRHLMTQHQLKWPPGHKNFRYKITADGNYRLQTVRYESLALSRQMNADVENQNNDNNATTNSSVCNEDEANLLNSTSNQEKQPQAVNSNILCDSSNNRDKGKKPCKSANSKRKRKAEKVEKSENLVASSDALNSPEKQLSPRKRPRKPETPTKFFRRLQQCVESSSDEDQPLPTATDDGEKKSDESIDVMQFVTEDGEVITVDTTEIDVSQVTIPVQPIVITPDCTQTTQNYAASSSLIADDRSLTGDHDLSDVNDDNPYVGNSCNNKTNYFTVTLKDKVVGLVSNSTGNYYPVPDGYELNVNSTTDGSDVVLIPVSSSSQSENRAAESDGN